MRRITLLLLCAALLCGATAGASAEGFTAEMMSAFTEPAWAAYAPTYVYQAKALPVTAVVMEGYNQRVLCFLRQTNGRYALLDYNTCFMLRDRPCRLEEADGKLYVRFPADAAHPDDYRFQFVLERDKFLLLAEWRVQRADGSATTVTWPDWQWQITDTAADGSVTAYPAANVNAQIVHDGWSWGGYFGDLLGYKFPSLMAYGCAIARGERARMSVPHSETASVAYIKGMYSSVFLNFRAAPDVGSECLGRYYGGTPVTILDDSSKIWCRVRIGDREGYLKRNYLCFGDDASQLITPPPTATTAEAAVLLATDLKAPLGSIPAGETVDVLGESGRYAHVRWGEGIGFVLLEQLEGYSRLP